MSKLNFMPYELTEDQKQLVKEIKEFFSSTKLSFTISGSAGTGKSFVTNHIIKSILRPYRVAVTAPTHKAVRVIENFTGKKGHTLHSLHGLRPNYSLEDFNIDNIKYESIGNIKFNEYQVIFIDEASMINRDLKILNDTRSKQFNTKIVYLGDKLQLPPVKEDSPSDVFTKVDQTYELTEVIRQAEDNPLLDVFEILKVDIVKDTAKFINYIRKNPTKIVNGGGYELLNLHKFKEIVKYYFTSEEFNKDINYCRYAGYTKESVNTWNRYIRALLFPTTDILVEGDILAAYKTIVDDNNSPILTNSTDYKVTEVIPRISDDKFKCFHVKLLDLVTLTTVVVSVVDHTDPSFKNYYDVINNLHRQAYYASGAERGRRYKNYFKFKDTHLCMANFNLMDKASKKPRGYVTKELAYGYGITVHKLQGSTLKNIVLDGLDITYVKGNTNKPRVNTPYTPSAISLRNRLLYTGLSRANNMAHILF